MASLIPAAEVAEAIWAERVRANREQVDHFREVGDEVDFYGSVATMFRDDPHREHESALNALRPLVLPDQVWLDIGAGAGRYALPIALRARKVIALDASPGMLEQLRGAMAETGIENVQTIQARWPVADPPRTDVAFIAHVGYDIEQIGPFLDAMETAASRLCVAMLFEPQPTRPYDDLWPAVHGTARSTLPALREFLALLLARGRLFELRLAERLPHSFESPEQALHFARRQTWVAPGGDKDRRLEALLQERLQERDGRYAFSWQPGAVGIVSWDPGQ
jgi:SAM-dependent methyltransferase